MAMKTTSRLLKQVTRMFDNPLIVFSSGLNMLSRWKQHKLRMNIFVLCLNVCV